ncbi:MAG: hypothetical protein GY807_08300 [Gammaproteobacteria bacterium]|nr:hypothetical protein [Gammaproteobacteria bacterium]
MAHSEYLLFFITITVGLVGIIFLFFPDRVAKLERWLNTAWGEQEIAAVRLDLPGEQRLEQVLNRNVLDKRITWDQWARNHPRLTGTYLCVGAGILWWVSITA